jgi:hypothetical protein
MHVLPTSDVVFFVQKYRLNSIFRIKEQTMLNTIAFIVIKIQSKNSIYGSIST